MKKGPFKMKGKKDFDFGAPRPEPTYEGTDYYGGKKFNIKKGNKNQKFRFKK